MTAKKLSLAEPQEPQIHQKPPFPDHSVRGDGKRAGQKRVGNQRIPVGRHDQERLVADMSESARQYVRYRHRRIATLLRDAGWNVNGKRVERLKRQEGLKVPMKQPKKRGVG